MTCAGYPARFVEGSGSAPDMGIGALPIHNSHPRLEAVMKSHDEQRQGREERPSPSSLMIELPDVKVVFGTIAIVMAVLAFLYKANLFAAIGYGFVDFATVKDIRDDMARTENRFKSLDAKLDKHFDKIDDRLGKIDDRLSTLSAGQQRNEADLKAHISEYERTWRLFRNQFLDAPKPSPPGVGKSVSTQP